MCVNGYMATKLLSLSAALLLAAALGAAHAAELGDAQVGSYMGQPLVADIELTSVADASQAVTVRLASPDVYRGANIAMHPVLASLAMTVVRRDGRQYVHLTSSRPVASEYIHLFLELSDGGKRNVRAATLWLAADPNPAPPPAPAPAVTVPVAAPVVAKAANSVAAVREPRDEPAPAPKPVRVLTLPSAGASCPQKFSEEQIKACAATEYQNGLLSAQIVELEDKIKVLQLAAEGKAPAASASASAAASAASSAAPAKKITPSLLSPKPVAKVEAGFPWLLVSGIVVLLAAIGGGVYFWLSRRKKPSAEAAAADSVAWYSKLASRFKRKPKAILLTEPEEGGDA
jgi:hypothetical protein